MLVSASWPKHEIRVAACYLFAATVALILTRIEGGIALMWPANGLVAAMLIRSAQVRWFSMIVLLFAAGILSNVLVAHREWHTAIVLLTCLNGVEIALMVWAFRRALRYDYPDISIDQSAIMTVVFGVAIPGLVSLAAGWTLRGPLGLSFFDGATQWWSSHTLGACLVGPPVILWSTKALRRLVGGKYLFVNLAMLIGVPVVAWISFEYIRFPFVVISVMLLVSAFRVGGLGASLLSLVTSLSVAVLWAMGVRPVGLEKLPMDFSLAGLPVIALLATTMPPIAVGLGTDARRAVARKLHASERRFRESMEHSPIGMLIANVDGVWGYTNLALQRMLGYTADELRAFPPGGPSDPEELAATSVRQRLMADEISTYNGERRFLHKEGHWVWTHVAASLVRDEDGSPLYLIAQIENLEARRVAEARLADDRERLRITLMSIDDAVITTDARLRVSYVNTAAESMLGLSKEAAEGRHVQEVLHLTDPQTSKAAANLIGQSAIHAKVFRRESACILHRPDGSFCFIMDVVSPVLDSSGMLTGMVIVLRDASSEVNRAQDLTHRANHDALTGLYNRAAFDQRLSEIFGRCRVLDRPASLLAIDLDRFKSLNDAAGHAAGDAALLRVAEICRQSVRASDMVARLGGDEFAIILDNCSGERAEVIGQKVLKALNPVNIEWQGSSYSIGASIGVAAWEESMVSEADWTAAADRACYSAKRGGRGQLQMESSARSA